MTYQKIQPGHPAFDVVKSQQDAGMWVCDSLDHNEASCSNPNCFKYNMSYATDAAIKLPRYQYPKWTLGLESKERQRCQDLMLIPSSVFVFGSNLAGIHGAGAAKFACDLCGAIPGVGIGRAGRSYALPTKDENITTMSVRRIYVYVTEFLQLASVFPETPFIVTRIGCGLAGYTDRDIAPMFENAPWNCFLPIGWRVEEKREGELYVPRETIQEIRDSLSNIYDVDEPSAGHKVEYPYAGAGNHIETLHKVLREGGYPDS